MLRLCPQRLNAQTLMRRHHIYSGPHTLGGGFVICIRLQGEVLKESVLSITVAHSLSLPVVTSAALVKALLLEDVE